MAKKTGSKSDAVRKYLAKRPNSSIKQIVAGLKAEGVKVSAALASKIKYNPPGKTSGRRGSRNKGRGSKAAAIREQISSMHKPVRPRDVIAALKAKGMAVSSAQVSAVAKSMGMRRRGGRKPALAGVAARTSKAPKAISLDDLIAAKKLADDLGGVDRAMVAVDALAKLG